MSLPHIVMGMLQWGAQSGYDLDKQMKQVVRFTWEANQSSVYRALHKCADEGWVDIEVVRQDDNPDKKLYHLTASGLAELKRWLAQPGLSAPTRFPFLAQLLWSHLIPIEDQLVVLRERLDDVNQALSLLEARADYPDGMHTPLPPDAILRGLHRTALSLDYGIRNYRFEKDFLEDAIAMLEHTLAHGGERAP